MAEKTHPTRREEPSWHETPPGYVLVHREVTRRGNLIERWVKKKKKKNKNKRR